MPQFWGHTRFHGVYLQELHWILMMKLQEDPLLVLAERKEE